MKEISPETGFHISQVLSSWSNKLKNYHKLFDPWISCPTNSTVLFIYESLQFRKSICADNNDGYFQIVVFERTLKHLINTTNLISIFKIFYIGRMSISKVSAPFYIRNKKKAIWKTEKSDEMPHAYA